MALDNENQTLNNTDELENDNQINEVPEEEEYKIKATNPRFVFEAYKRRKLFDKERELNDDDVIRELDEEDEDIESEYVIEDALYKANENESISTQRVTMPEFYSRLELRKQSELVKDRALSRLSAIMTDVGIKNPENDSPFLHSAYSELVETMDNTPGLDGKSCTMHEVAVAFFDKSYSMLGYSGLSEKDRIITAQKMADVMSRSYSPIGFVYGELNRYADNYVVGNGELLTRRLMENGDFSKEECMSLVQDVKATLESAVAKKQNEVKSENEPELLPWDELTRYAPRYHKQLANRIENGKIAEQVKKQIGDILREALVKETAVVGEDDDTDKEIADERREAEIKTAVDEIFEKNIENISGTYENGSVLGSVSFLAKWIFISNCELLENKEMDAGTLIGATQKISNLILKTYSPVAFANSGELNKYADDYVISSESNLRECLSSSRVSEKDIESFLNKDKKEEIIVNENNIEKNQQNVDGVTEILPAQDEIDIPAVGEEEPIVENASNNLYSLNVGLNGEASIVPTEAFFKQLRDRTDDPARTAEVVSQLTDILGEAGFADVYNDETIRYFRDAVAQTMFMISEPGQEITMTDVVKNVYSRVKVTFMNDEQDPEKQAVNTQKIADLILKNYSPVAFAGGELDEYANGYVLNNKDMFGDMLTGADTIYINASDPIDADFVGEPERVDADPFEKIESINNNVNTLFLWDSDLVNAIVQRADDPDLIAQVNPQFNAILGEAGVAEVNHPSFAEGIRKTMVSHMLRIGEPADDKTFRMQDVTEHVFKGAYDLMRFVMSDASEVSKIVVAQKVADVVLKNYSPAAFVNGEYDNYADNYMLKNDYLIQLALVEGKLFSEEAALSIVHELRQELVSLGIQQDDASIGLEQESVVEEIQTIELETSLEIKQETEDINEIEENKQEIVAEEIVQEPQPEIKQEPQPEIEQEPQPEIEQAPQPEIKQDNASDTKQENEPENNIEANEAPVEATTEKLSKHQIEKAQKSRYAKMRIARKQKFKEVRKEQKELALEKLHEVSVAEQPVIEQPAVNEPVVNEPVANQPEANQTEANQPVGNQPEAKQAPDPVSTLIASQKAKVKYEIEETVHNINDKESVKSHIVHMPRYAGFWYNRCENADFKDHVRAQIVTALRSRGYQNNARFPYGLITNTHNKVSESIGWSNDIDGQHADMVEVASLCFREAYESLAPTNLSPVDRVITAQNVADVILKNYSHAALVNGELDQYTKHYVVNNNALLKDQLAKLNIEKADELAEDVRNELTPKLTEESLRHMFGNDVDVAKYIKPDRGVAEKDEKAQEQKQEQVVNPEPVNAKTAPKLTEEMMRHMFGNDVNVAKYMNPNREPVAENKQNQQQANLLVNDDDEFAADFEKTEAQFLARMKAKEEEQRKLEEQQKKPEEEIDPAIKRENDDRRMQELAAQMKQLAEEVDEEEVEEDKNVGKTTLDKVNELAQRKPKEIKKPSATLLKEGETAPQFTIGNTDSKKSLHAILAEEDEEEVDLLGGYVTQAEQKRREAEASTKKTEKKPENAPKVDNTNANVALFLNKLKAFNEMYKLNIDPDRFAASVIDSWSSMKKSTEQEQKAGKEELRELFKGTLKDAFEVEKKASYDDRRFPEYAEIIKSSNELMRTAMYAFTDLYHNPKSESLFAPTAFGGLTAKEMADLTTGDSLWTMDQKSDKAWEIQSKDAKDIASEWQKADKPYEKLIEEMNALIEANKGGTLERNDAFNKLTAAEWMLINNEKMMIDDPEDPLNPMPNWGNRYWKAITSAREAIGIDKHTSMRELIQGEYAASAKAATNRQYNTVQIEYYVTNPKTRVDSIEAQKEQFATQSAHVELTEPKNKDNLEETLLPDGRAKLNIKELDQRNIMKNEPKNNNFIVPETTQSLQYTPQSNTK